MSLWYIWLNTVTGPQGETRFVPASYINSPVSYTVSQVTLSFLLCSDIIILSAFRILSEAWQTPVLWSRVRVQCPHWPHWHWHDQRSHRLNVCPSLPWQRANHCPNLVKGQLSLPVLLQWEAGFIRIQTHEHVSLPVSALTFQMVQKSLLHSYVLSFNQYHYRIAFWSRVRGWYCETTIEAVFFHCMGKENGKKLW